MLFQSQLFLLVFLPIAVLGWYAVARFTAAREWWLIATSLVFYGWWDARFVPLLVGMAVLSWLAARLYQHLGAGHRWVLGVAIAGNLAILAFFKYALFFASNVAALVGAQPPTFSILLPIGISFFTFEIISYLVDLGWRNAPGYGFRRFSLFIAFFPRLIAGPIVRHNEIIPQYDLDPLREGLHERIAKGLLLLTVGLVTKVALADQLAPIADSAFLAAGQSVSMGQAWTGALAFTLQLFLDFSAYSDMAMGIALMFGLTLPQNFYAPYRATNLRAFWRSWHMTLSRYLRDYLYIPLGGNRQGVLGFAATTLFTMGLCGLWHGAGWNFILWGLLHGVGLLVCRAWQDLQWPMPPIAGWALTFGFVVIGWVLFRAPSMDVAWTMLAAMSGKGGFSGAIQQPLLLAAAAAVALIRPPLYERVLTQLKPAPAIAVLGGIAAAVMVLMVGAGQPVNFIYFQF